MAFRRLGVPMIDGVIAGIKSKEKDLQKQFSETLTFLFAEEDIIKEVKGRQYYIKPSLKKILKRKKAEAQRRKDEINLIQKILAEEEQWKK